MWRFSHSNEGDVYLYLGQSTFLVIGGSDLMWWWWCLSCNHFIGLLVVCCDALAHICVHYMFTISPFVVVSVLEVLEIELVYVLLMMHFVAFLVNCRCIVQR